MISLIVPVYNIKMYIGKCISSIIAQTYQEFELILVDDGSTDGSSAVCDACKKQDSRIVVIHKENGGLVSARKAGIAAARGEYIGFVDGDDWVEPQMYEKLMTVAVKYQADMVLGGSIEDVGGKTKKKVNRIKTGIYDKVGLQKEIYPYMLCAGNFFCMGVQPYLWNKLIRRELAYDNVMAVDDRIKIGEDVAAVMPMLLKAHRIVITDCCDYHYCIKKTSMMWKYEGYGKEWENLRMLHNFLADVFSEQSIQCRLEEQLNHYSIGNMLTRIYGRFAEKDGKGTLWPFGYQISNRKCIVYSAGNFGRAVYGYLQDQYPCIISLWVDQEYQMYQSLGLPVHSVEEITEERDILVAVLDQYLAEKIRENLIWQGVCREQVYCIHIADETVKQICSNM